MTDVSPMTPAAAMKKPMDGAARAGGQPHSRDRRQRHDEAPALEQVAERQQEDQSCRVTDLGGRHDETGDGLRHPEELPDAVEERLGQVVAGDRLAGRDREQQDEAAAHAAAGDVFGDVLRGAHTT